MRIAEAPSPGTEPPSDTGPAVAAPRPIRSAGVHRRWIATSCHPRHRTIVALDMEKSTLRTNPVKRELRHRTYLILDEALRQAGIRERHLDRLTDRGDGVLALIRPVDEVPKTLLLDVFTPVLHTLLLEYNAGVADDPARCLRLRMVIHAGEVHDDGQGFFGEELDVAFRLLDARRVKRALARAHGPLAVVVSDEIYRAIVLHGYGGIDAGDYEPGVRVRVLDRQRYGWINVPGAAAPLP